MILPGRVVIRSTDLRMWSSRAWQRYREAWERIKKREEETQNSPSPGPRSEWWHYLRQLVRRG